MRVHVLRNVLGPIFVYATSLISVSIILASGLSFLGLGVEPPKPEWGLMLNTLRPAIYVNPLVAALPGAPILITSICFNLLTDGLRQCDGYQRRHERPADRGCRSWWSRGLRKYFPVRGAAEPQTAGAGR